LETKTSIKRRTRLKYSNPERMAKKYARNFGSHGDFIRSLPCAVRSCERRDIEAAHVIKRKMGGCGGDWRDQAPLCGPHHREQEPHRVRRGELTPFEVRYALNLQALRRALVVANPDNEIHEQLAAWDLLTAEHSLEEVANALQLAHDLTGYHVAPPAAGQGVGQ
jgi:hypothetical protein